MSITDMPATFWTDVAKEVARLIMQRHSVPMPIGSMPWAEQLEKLKAQQAQIQAQNDLATATRQNWQSARANCA